MRKAPERFTDIGGFVRLFRALSSRRVISAFTDTTLRLLKTTSTGSVEARTSRLTSSTTTLSFSYSVPSATSRRMSSRASPASLASSRPRFRRQMIDVLPPSVTP